MIFQPSLRAGTRSATRSASTTEICARISTTSSWWHSSARVLWKMYTKSFQLRNLIYSRFIRKDRKDEKCYFFGNYQYYRQLLNDTAVRRYCTLFPNRTFQAQRLKRYSEKYKLFRRIIQVHQMEVYFLQLNSIRPEFCQMCFTVFIPVRDWV